MFKVFMTVKLWAWIPVCFQGDLKLYSERQNLREVSGQRDCADVAGTDQKSQMAERQVTVLEQDNLVNKETSWVFNNKIRLRHPLVC